MFLMSETAVLDPGTERLDLRLTPSNSIKPWDALDGDDPDRVEPARQSGGQQDLYHAPFARLRLALADGF